LVSDADTETRFWSYTRQRRLIIAVRRPSMKKVKSVAKRKLEMVKKSILVCQRSYLVLFLIIRYNELKIN